MAHNFVSRVGFLLALSSGLVFARAVTIADLQRADSFYQEGRYQEALQLYELIAGDTAYAPAQFMTGLLYASGKGVAPDCGAAARWYTYAASQKHADAAYNLYVLYSNGCSDFAVDPTRAERWLLKAADLGNPFAMAKRAAAMATDPDNGYAAYALAKSAVDGTDDGYPLIILASLVEQGVGVPPDRVQARAILRMAWQRQSRIFGYRQLVATAIATLASTGPGTVIDPEEALKWWLVAGILGDPEAEEQVQELVKRIAPEQVSRIREVARKTADDTGDTAMSNDELFVAFAQSFNSDLEKAAKLASALTAAGDHRANMVNGSLALVSEHPVDALEHFKKGCDALPGGMSCLFYAETLLALGHEESARAVLKPLALKRDDGEVAWNTGSLRRLIEALRSANMTSEADVISSFLPTEGSGP